MQPRIRLLLKNVLQTLSKYLTANLSGKPGEGRAAVCVWRDVDVICGAEWIGDALGKTIPSVSSTPRMVRHHCRHQQLAIALVPSPKWLFLLLCPPLPKKPSPIINPSPAPHKLHLAVLRGNWGRRTAKGEPQAFPTTPNPACPGPFLPFSPHSPLLLSIQLH